MLFDWCKCKSFAYSQTQKIGKGPFISNFNLLAHLLGWKWAITRNSTHEVLGQISRSPKGTKSKCYSKILYNIVQPYNKLLFLLSHRQSPIYSGFLFATAQVESLTAMIFFAFISLIAYLTKILPVKEALRHIVFVRWFRKGNMLSMCLQ